MNIKQKMQLHDRLYRHADKLIKKYSPCKIEGKTCLYGRLNYKHIGGLNPCCKKCKYLGKKGCTVECLMCKMYLCFLVRQQFPKLFRMLLRINKQAYTHNIMQFRRSRKDVMDNLNMLKKEE